VGAPGTLYVSELRPLAAAGGAGWSRTLHVLAPFPKAWRSHQRVCFTCLSPSVTITLDELHALARPIDCGPAIDRGFGLELELLSVPADTDAGHFSKVAELHALLNEAERVALAAPDAQLATLVRQIRRWQVSLDPACLPFPLPTATLLLPRMRAMGALSDEDALLMLSSRQRTTPTEYKSALPPHELCFSSAEPEKVREGPRESGSVREGPRKSGSILGTPLKSRPCARAEIALGLRLISKLGVSAPSVSESGCECNTSLHVHVNVRSPHARGRLLSAREILAVFLSWVRFDAVTMRFCRSWCWADRWASPLFATGSEFHFSERPLHRGESAHLERAAANDIPAFFQFAHKCCNEELDGLGGEEERVARLFGEGGSKLGKYCSLNLLPLRLFGTLEFRRQHASTDETLIARWAHFCVAFVETFAAEDLLEPYLKVGAEEGLMKLKTEQRLATVDELMLRLGARVPPDLPAFLLACGCGPHVADCPEAESF